MEQTAKTRSCYKCGYYAETTDTTCPKCSRTLFSATATCVRGFLMMLCGLVLMGMMGYISLWALSAVDNNGVSGSRFTGTQQEKLAIFVLFGVIILFGFGSFVTGSGQLVTGRRSKFLAWAVAGLGVIVFAIAGAVYWVL